MKIGEAITFYELFEIKQKREKEKKEKEEEEKKQEIIDKKIWEKELKNLNSPIYYLFGEGNKK